MVQEAKAMLGFKGTVLSGGGEREPFYWDSLDDWGPWDNSELSWNFFLTELAFDLCLPSGPMFKHKLFLFGARNCARICALSDCIFKVVWLEFACLGSNFIPPFVAVSLVTARSKQLLPPQHLPQNSTKINKFV